MTYWVLVIMLISSNGLLVPLSNSNITSYDGVKYQTKEECVSQGNSIKNNSNDPNTIYFNCLMIEERNK